MAKIEGLDELSKALSALGAKAGGKALRQTTSRLMRPVLRKIKLKVPRGTKAHKTYKGRYVAPGFASRNIIMQSRYRRGKAVTWIGVQAEAYYILQFMEDWGQDLDVSERNKKPIKPYRIPAKKWFFPTFENSQEEIELEFFKELERNIDKALR